MRPAVESAQVVELIARLRTTLLRCGLNEKLNSKNIFPTVPCASARDLLTVFGTPRRCRTGGWREDPAEKALRNIAHVAD